MAPCHLALYLFTIFLHHIGTVNQAHCVEIIVSTPKCISHTHIDRTYVSPIWCITFNASCSTSIGSTQKLRCEKRPLCMLNIWQRSASSIEGLSSDANENNVTATEVAAPKTVSVATKIPSKLNIIELRRARVYRRCTAAGNSGNMWNIVERNHLSSHAWSPLSSLSSPSPPLHWSPANVELMQAVVKITILIVLKIAVKYYIRGYLKTRIAAHTIAFELIDLSAKAYTIAIAKFAIKRALYPALRSAAKTFVIASLKSIVKPFSSPLIKASKKRGDQVTCVALAVTFMLAFAVKVVIKTIALEMLVLVFENETTTSLPLHQLMLRVSLILFVKLSAKRVCKMNKSPKSKSKKLTNNNNHNNNEADNSVNDRSFDTSTSESSEKIIIIASSESAPVDKIMQFAIEKLVTKLVKIPLIKMLL